MATAFIAAKARRNFAAKNSWAEAGIPEASAA
jgi:hypothetical protein